MGLRAASILALLLALGGPAGAARAASGPASGGMRLVRYQARRYLYLRDVARFYGMDCRVRGRGVVLGSRYSRLEFEADSRVCVLNGVAAHLSYAVYLPGREPLVSVNDFSNLLDPVLRSRILPRRRIRRILVDPGHGGKDPGAQVGKVAEKDLALRMGIILAQELQRSGYHVVMTRNRDRDLTLRDRTGIAESHQVDLMVSIHCNAAGDRSVQGIEVYAPNPRGTPSSGGGTVARDRAASDPVARENALLGYLVQACLVRDPGAVDRGFRRKQFFVLRNCRVPAVLVETGFLTNPGELRRLQTEAFQRRLAASVREAVRRFETALGGPPGGAGNPTGNHRRGTCGTRR